MGVHEADVKNEMRSIHSQCDQPFEELGMEAIYLVGIHIRNSNSLIFFFFLMRKQRLFLNYNKATGSKMATGQIKL